jgi:hypothetical protein
MKGRWRYDVLAFGGVEDEVVLTLLYRFLDHVSV